MSVHCRSLGSGANGFFSVSQLLARSGALGQRAAGRLAAKRPLRRRSPCRAPCGKTRCAARSTGRSAPAVPAPQPTTATTAAMRTAIRIGDKGSASIDSPRNARRQADLRHRRRRLHRHDARADGSSTRTSHRRRQPPPRRALGHAARRASELHVPPGGRPRPRGDARALEGGDAHRPLRGDRGRRHRPREPGADDARERHRHLQRARGRASATLDTLERFVDFSTSEVFGTHAFRVEEGQVSTIGSVGEARWTYAVSKLAGEHMAHAYHDELGLPAVTVHPFNVFGPGQIGGGAIRAFIEDALAGRDLVIHGDGSQIRAWCYVDDMVAGTLARLEHPDAVGQAFNIGNPRSTVTIYDLAQRIKRLTGARRRDHLPAAALRRRRAADPERREGARAARLRGEGRPRRGPREDDRVVPREACPRIRLAFPDARGGRAGRGARRLRVGRR